MVVGGKKKIPPPNLKRPTNLPHRGVENSEPGLTRPKPEVGTPAAFRTGGASALVESGLLNSARSKMLKNPARTSNDIPSRIRKRGGGPVAGRPPNSQSWIPILF